MASGKIILITGGSRGGKSRYALSLADNISGTKVFLATAEPLDEFMKKKIQNHQEERKGEFLTIEEPVYLAKAIKTMNTNPSLIVIDCLTVWVNNLLHYLANDKKKIRGEIDNFLQTIKESSADIIMVTNEIGLGVIPENPLVRDFIDELGLLNQKISEFADEVIFMVSGIPQKIKGETYHAEMDRASEDYSTGKSRLVYSRTQAFEGTDTP